MTIIAAFKTLEDALLYRHRLAMLNPHRAEFRGVPALSARPAGMMGYASRMTGEKQCLN